MKSESIFWFITFLFISRPFSILFHELGHAIPILLMTNDKVIIFVGSHGKTKNSFKIKLARLEINFNYNLFQYHGGLCVRGNSELTKNQTLFFIATGPIASLIAGLFSYSMAFIFDFPDFISIFFFVFMIYALFDFIKNIIPRKTPILLKNGTYTFNDGESISRILKADRYATKYANALSLYNDKNYKDSLSLFNDLLNDEFIEENIFRLKISCHFQLKEYETALKILEKFNLNFRLNSDDYANLGFVQSHFNNHLLAIENYDKSLDLNPENSYSLNNKGYTLNILERYNEAIIYFDRAIEIDPKMAYAYNNRGLAKIKSGKIEDGLADLNYSNSLNPENSYYYRNIGIYHQDRGELDLALEFYLKSKSLDSDTHDIDVLIQDAQRLLEI